MESKSAENIRKLLKTTTDKRMIRSIPASHFVSLSIDISDIPSTNLPKSLLRKYSRALLSNQSIADISDSDTLSKVLPGLTKKDLKKITHSEKVDSLVILVNASLRNGIDLSSAQV